MLFEYDDSKPLAIEKYARCLIGKTFNDVIEDYEAYELAKAKSDSKTNRADKKRKGGLGEIIEKYYFGYEPNSDPRPDFYKAGVELKVTPCKEKNNSNELISKERLSITMIDYNKVVNETFETSHLWSKARLILLIYYLYQPDVKSRLEYKIKFASLFSPPAKDLVIIKEDFEKIAEKVRAGLAHELSEVDTLYLGAAPKATDSSVRRSQPFSSVPAKPRCFCYKNSYMTFVLNNYIISNRNGYESITGDDKFSSFESYVKSKIDAYRLLSIQRLCEYFNLSYEKAPKNLMAILTYKMLGIRGNKAEEFEKANIAIKTIRIQKNGKIKENMSFPNFKFKEIINEDWEDSYIYNYLSGTRFLFVVYCETEDGYVLKGCQFWNMPYKDLVEDVHSVWKKTKELLIEGFKFERVDGKYRNNFPKASENPVCHVRPHGRDSNDTLELPDGRMYPKQSFWLSNDYILSQLDDDLIIKN